MTTSTTPTARLSLTAAERQLILEEYDSYPRGDPRRGALLRRYGLYTSQMAKWRERLKRGDGTLASARPGPQPLPRNPLADAVARLTRENTRLHQQLTNAETIIAIQKNRQGNSGVRGVVSAQRASRPDKNCARRWRTRYCLSCSSWRARCVARVVRQRPCATARMPASISAGLAPIRTDAS